MAAIIDAIYAGTIAISLVIMQAFISIGTLDRAAFISLIAFAIAIPALSIAIAVRLLSSKKVKAHDILGIFGALSATVGVIAAFWHISWILGVYSLLALLVHWYLFFFAPNHKQIKEPLLHNFASLPQFPYLPIGHRH